LFLALCFKLRAFFSRKRPPISARTPGHQQPHLLDLFNLYQKFQSQSRLVLVIANKGAGAALMITGEAAATMAASEAPVTGLQVTTPEEKTFMESAKEQLRKMNSPAVEQYLHWARTKAREAGDYATLRTRQGISLFGEPNIGAIKTIVDRC
jgi:hypothetical protein